MKTKLRDVSPRDEKISSAISCNEANDRRIFILAIAHHDVADSGDLVASGVEYRPVQNLGQIEHRIKIAEFD